MIVYESMIMVMFFVLCITVQQNLWNESLAAEDLLTDIRSVCLNDGTTILYRCEELYIDPRNLQLGPRVTDSEKTWLSNSSIATYSGVRW